jgi:uncharacterized caspase-like protein
MKKLFLAVLALIMLAANVQAAERRIALVIGNANYQTGALPTPANDAGLVAQTLQAAGFDVTGARDLDQDSLRHAFRDFADKAAAAGPDAVAFIYLSGYGLQLEGENYFVPIDARINSASNAPAEALRISDFTRPLAGLGLRATVLVLDLARANPFAQAGPPLSGGLALVDSEPGMLIAFNAAPGTVAPDEAGPYSAYAQALAETMREGGVALDEVFARVRLRVNQTTNGAQVPWDAAKLQASLYLFDRAPDAPLPQVTPAQTASIRTRPIRDFSASDAYLAALNRDSLDDYESFLAAYPHDPMGPRVRAIVAARREAITWRGSRNIDTPQAYWSYLERYPRGAHSADARRRLAHLSAAFDPPPSFAVVPYDVPPPLPEEIFYVERPVLVFDDPDFGFAPPPPPPIVFLPPPPVYFVDLPPPPPPLIAFVLPIPEYRPVPVWVIPPPQIVRPPNNIIYNNIHNEVVINNMTNIVTITDPQGQTQTMTPAAAAAAVPAAATPAAGSPSVAPPPSGAAPAASKAAIAAAGLGAAGVAAALAPSLPTGLARKAAEIPNPQLVAPARPLAPGGILRAQAPALQPPTSGAQPAAPATPPPNNKLGSQPPQLIGKPAAPTGLPPAPPAQPGSPAPAGAKGTGPAAGPLAPTNGKQIGQPLPGASGGQPLPAVNGKPVAPTGLPPIPPAQPVPQAPAAAKGTAAPAAGLLAPTNGKQIGQPPPGASGGQPLPAANGKPAAPTGVPPAAPAHLGSPAAAGAKGTAPAAGPLAPTNGKQIGQPLPGASGGQPLPAVNGKPVAPTGLPPVPPAQPVPQAPAAAKGTAAPTAPPVGPKLNGKAVGQSLPGAGGGQPLPSDGKQPSISNQPSTTSPSRAGTPKVGPGTHSPSAKPPTPPAAKLPSAPPAAAKGPPVLTTPPRPPAARLALPAPPERRPPPSSAAHVAPPAPVYHAPPPQAPAGRLPAPVYHPPPANPVIRVAPPPAAAVRPPAPPPPAAGRSLPKGCVLPNGQPCPPR